MKQHIRIRVASADGAGRHEETLAVRRTSPWRAGQRVRIAGEREVFTVLRVDPHRYLADLLREGAVHTVEAGIPLAVLLLVSEPGELDELQVSA